MPTERVEAKSGEEKQRSKRRLRLMESYGAFSDDKLQEVADKIKGITTSNTLSSPSSRLPSFPPLGDPIGDPIDEPMDTPMGVPIQSSIKTTIQTPIDSPHVKPDEIANETPIDSPIDSPLRFEATQPANRTSLLTENQAILYFCLDKLAGAVTSLHRIALETNISEHTLKSCLRKLTKEGLIQYGGRRNCGGRIGFTAQTIQHNIILRGDKTRLAKRLQQINYAALPFAEPIDLLDSPSGSVKSSSYPMNHLMKHPIEHQISNPINQSTDTPIEHLLDHRTVNSSSSSIYKEQLLQNLVFENAFQNLNPRSLLPFLDQFESTEEVQNFLDMANACITASKEGRSKPISNPQGFLFAQLRQGFINPPEGYKSRRIYAQERRNQQLEDELATLRQLKEREQELQFELFKANLTEKDWSHLEQEARKDVKSNIGLSPERQLAVNKDAILREWFASQEKRDRGSV